MSTVHPIDRRAFLAGIAASAAAFPSLAQSPGDRPAHAATITVELPRLRTPVGLIIDDSTCLVNLNKFAMPQFDEAFGSSNPVYRRNWREWPNEIPDAFVRKFGEWAAANGIKGKYSIVPYPACVGRLDRGLPGWSQADLRASLEVVRTTIMPNWDIHPEMITHTRVIDLATGQPFPEISAKFMENWEWTTGRSADEIGAYLTLALSILRDVGLPCEGITTPGGFGNRALPQLAQATLESVRGVFHAEIPHYFRHAFDKGPESVAPRVEYASGLDGPDPRCVVSIVACTGDWTGGWDNTEPKGADAFITEDGKGGRMVEVIGRGEPAMMLAHWTGIWWLGQERGFTIFKEVVRRLQTRFDRLLWMRPSELSRYWAARELTAIAATDAGADFHAPFPCPSFTVRCGDGPAGKPTYTPAGAPALVLDRVDSTAKLVDGTWCRDGVSRVACLPLRKGASRLVWND